MVSGHFPRPLLTSTLELSRSPKHISSSYQEGLRDNGGGGAVWGVVLAGTQSATTTPSPGPLARFQ